MVLPRSDTSSSPSLVASASAFFLSPSAITSTRVPISATSPYGKQWAIETDRMPSLPSIAMMRSTSARIGCSVVG